MKRLLRRSGARKTPRRFQFESLEPRLALACGAGCLEVPLLAEFDQFGPQIETVMAYKGPGESDEESRVAFAIYDTGASVVTFSPGDQLLFELLQSPIPIKVEGGAVADAIGGPLMGDVSEAGQIIADGLHSVTITADILDLQIDLSEAVRTEGVQAFVGTTSGSPILPTITGTVVHNPSPAHPQGVAAQIDMTAYEFDFGALFPEFPEFEGIVVNLPDLRFVDPGTKLTAPDDGSITTPVRIPLELWGENNHGNPGDLITTSPNPVQTAATLRQGAASVGDQTLLFDTGAQLTVISTEIALGLGLDLHNPETSLTVQGAAGQVTVPGYTIEALELPRDDDGDGTIDGILQFSNVPIYVLDIVPGLDGLIGMNLFNTAKELLYDPHDPGGASLQLTFFTDLIRELPGEEELAAIDFLAQSFPAFGGALGGGGLPSFGVAPPPVNQLPVPLDDAATTDEDQAVTIDVLANDSDGDGDGLSVSGVGDPANGAVTVNANNTLTYTPDDDFHGSDTFTYTISDGNGGEATATVTVTVNSVNDDPAAGDDSATTDEDQAVTIDVLANDSDADGDGLSVTAVSDPNNGAVVINGDNTLTYTPDDDFHGSDAFTYTVSDGNGGEATATVTVTVEPVNDAPLEIALSGASVAENAPGAGIGAVTVSDPDAGDTHLLTVSDDRFEIAGGTLKLKDGVALDFETEATVVLEITAVDSGSPPLSRTETFTITVVDDPEGTPLWQNAGQRWDVDADGTVGINDLLEIVQALRRQGGAFPAPEANGENAPPPYLDVNGDDFISLADLLDAVVKIREDLSALEGEAERSSAVDAVFALERLDPWNRDEERRGRR